jgi:hypothetical protein
MKLLSFVVHALACLSLASCTFMKEQDATFIAVGGKGAYKKGEGVIWNNEKSFRDGALAAAAIAAGYFSAASSAAAEVTAQAASSNAASTAQKQAAANAAVEIQKSADAVKMAEIQAAAAAAP